MLFTPFTQKQTKRVKLILPRLHEWQAKFVNDPHRVVIATAGTKFGKTLGMSELAIREAWNNHGHLVWWVAPNYKQAQVAIDYISRMLPSGRYVPNKTAMSLTLRYDNGDPRSRIEFKSADNPDSLRGSGVHLAIMDEAAYIKEAGFVSVWTTMTQTRGKLRIISTPKGKGNWFHREWLRGWNEDLRREFQEYSSYKLPTYYNPYVPKESIEEFRRTMPADVFRQEVEADWLDDGAGVFRGVRACQTASWQTEPRRGAMYVMGVDFAKMQDYTVSTVIDYATREVVFIDRFTGQDWNVTTKRIIDLARRWNNARILADATGVGDVPVDSIKAVYPHCDGYVIGNNNAKVALIQKLQFAFETGAIRVPNPKAHQCAEQLDYELSIYGYELSSTGKYIFSAPSGANDDCVISLALANWLLAQEPTVYRAKQMRGI